MSNWTAITEDMLKAAGHSAIIAAAGTAGIGNVDPVAEAIENAVSKVRRGVSAGNDLDVDSTKVPNSLAGLTIRLAFYNLCSRIEYELSKDQADDKRNDQSEINRIFDKQIRVEAPDTAGGGGEMQSVPLPGIRPRPKQFSQQDEDGA